MPTRSLSELSAIATPIQSGDLLYIGRSNSPLKVTVADFMANLPAEYRIPVGARMGFMGTSAPTGWLKLNGAALSRTTYSDLWAHAQASGMYDATGVNIYQFGPGDGSTTFTLPDLRGQFSRNWDDGAGVDTGRGIGTYQADDIKSHTHADTFDIADIDLSHTHDSGTLASDAAGNHSHGPVGGGTFLTSGAGGNYGGGPTTLGLAATTDLSGNHTHTISGATATALSTTAIPLTGSVSATGATENTVKNVTDLWIIKY